MKKNQIKKKLLAACGIVLIFILIYFVGSGFVKNSSVFINDYFVSADGKEITVNVGVSSSMGYIRDIKVHQQQGSKLYLDCYFAFGGLNGSIGAKNSFTFELTDDISVIAVYRSLNCYEEVLVRTDDGSWQRAKP